MATTIKPTIAISADNDTPKSVEAWVEKGEALLAQEQQAEAIECCKAALALDARFNGAHTLMAQAMMPGDRYIPIMSRMHRQIKPQSYLEIGVATGKSLALASLETHCVGIDPNFRITFGIKSRARLYPITSDAFFSRYEIFKELEKDSLDLAFIDGLHYFEQALRDFINVEKFAHKDTVVLIHDCYPATQVGAQRERVTGYWTGDVWKVIVCLKELRADLQINIIPTFPSGLAVVTDLKATSTVLDEQFDEIVKKYREIDFSVFEDNEQGYFDTIPNDWEQISALLPDNA